jgi:Flp pilus assembly protein TadD
MQIDKPDAAVKSLVIAGAIGVTVGAPVVAPYVLPFLAPLIIEIGKAGLDTVKGVASNALWDMRHSFKPTQENEALTKLLAKAYSDAIADILEQDQNNDLINYILPDIKEKIDKNLASGNEIDLIKLFPKEENLLEIELDGQKKLPFYKRLLGEQPIEYRPVDNHLLASISSENFILNLSNNDETAKLVVAEEVELTLRRWFVQLNPSLAEEYTFPPSLGKEVFKKIGELIPVKINYLVKLEDFKDSWIAFQRSHLQAIHRQITDKQNGLSEDNRKLLQPLAEFLNKLSENNDLLQQLADSHSTILGKIGESEENIKDCIAEESKKLRDWLTSRLNEILTVGKKTLVAVIELDKKLTQVIAPEREGVELNLVSLPNRTDKIYGRNDEIAEILRFLRDEKKHGAIVLPTCYGKTSLIKKFLNETTDETKVKDEHRGLFEKVIYLFCYQNQNFQQIIRPFASLLGKRLEYTEGDEVNFLKQEVFDKLQDKKILLILDNFESWIDKNDKYLNDEVRIFVETLFNSNHQIRTLFVSQNLPHEEKDFFKKAVELKEIEKFLLKGLDKKSALELVRDEGDKENFKYVEDARLIEFFERVHYIPQAIQSMLAFVDEEIYTFDELMGAAWKEFEAEESDETEIEKQIPKELRPTRALLKHQLRKLDEKAQHLLSLAAFFDKPVPEEILLNDFGKYKQTELRRPLSKLFKHKLILRETDAQPATDHATGAKSAIHYFELHGFVGSTVNTMFPDFITENVKNLTALADQMEDKERNAWEAKLFEKQLALIGCWEVLEQELTGNRKMPWRQFNLDLVDFTKALALQGTTFANNRQIDADEIKRRVEIIENLYLKWLDKYPNLAEAYNNLGNLLVEDESRRAEAEEKYLRAIKLNPNDAEVYNNLGVLLAKDENRRAEAEEKYLRAIKLNPNDAEVYNNLGNLLAKDESRRAEAEEKYLRAIKLNPNDAEVYNNLGVLLAEDENRRAEAEEKYLQAIKLNPNYAKAYNNLGLLLAADESRRAEAEEKYLRAIELNPNYADAYNNLGVLLAEDESRRAEAEEKYLQAIKLNPNDASAYNNLGNLLDEDESRWAEAEEKYLRAIELNPNGAEAYGNLAFLKARYVGENAKDEIIGNLNKCLKLNPAYKNWVRNHPVFEFVRDDVRFREIVGD